MIRLSSAVVAALCGVVLATGCQEFASFNTPHETGEQCGDGIDNDGNGLIDCADPSCIGSLSCGSPDAGTADASRVDAARPDANAQMNASALLTPEQGGTVQLPNGASVIIPPGALDAPTTITITQINPPADGNIIPVGPTIVLGPEGLTFESPVTVTLPVDGIPATFTVADVVGLTAPATGVGSNQYTVLFGPAPGNAISVQTTHFSQFLPAVIATNCWNRSIAANPMTVPADGHSFTTITVLQQACPSLAYGQLIANVSVVGTDDNLSVDQGLLSFGGDVPPQPLFTTLSSDIAEIKQVNVTLTTESQPDFIVAQLSLPVMFIGQAPSAATSQLIIEAPDGGTTALADGVSSAKVTVILKGSSGGPIANFPVLLNVDNGATLSPQNGITDEDGIFVSSLTSNTPGLTTVMMQTAPSLSQQIEFVAACTTWNEASFNTGAQPQMQSVFGTSGSDIWAVGQDKAVLHYDGEVWESQNTGGATATKTYFGVWAADASHVWAVGEGLISVLDGETWQETTSLPTYFGVWGVDTDDAWIVGSSGTILFWNSGNFYEQSGTGIQGNPNINATCIGGTDSANIWVGTRDSSNQGLILWWNGEFWTTQFSGGQFTGVRSIIAISPSDVWAVGDSGMTLHYDGNEWAVVATDTTQNLNAVWATDTDHVWAVGNDSTILFWNGSSWSDESTTFAAADLLGVWALDSDDVVAVGALGADAALLSCPAGN